MKTHDTQQLALYTQALKKQQSQCSLLGNCKLILVLGLLISLYLLYRNQFSAPSVLISALLLAGVIVIWVIHGRAHGRMEFSKGLMAIHQDNLDRISGAWSKFPDTGAEFEDKTHNYAGDLDIVGRKSLFQQLNITHTWHGRNAFAADLLHPDYTPEDIQSRQQAVAELAQKRDFVNVFQYYTSKIGVNAAVQSAVTKLSDGALFLKHAALRQILLYLPLLTVILLVAMTLGQHSLLTVVALGLVVLQGVAWLIGLPAANRYLATASKAPHIFSQYVDALQTLGKETFGTPMLQEIQSSLVTGEQGAVGAIKRLDSISSMTHIKSNGIVYFVMNVLLLWDYRCAIQLSDWKQQYGTQCEDWFENIGRLESLNSFSGLINSCETTCMPVIQTDHRTLKATALGHPLLPNDLRIVNEVDVSGKLFIISGSNMSGKTTFLRTVGINLVLANAGSAVCAQTMTCGQFHLMTSMRIADDLNEGISTFYAELGKIKHIIDALRTRDDLFFLVDEIFRGTNSEDRLFGASAVIQELSRRGAAGLITTHDLALCDLTKQHKNIVNYSFSEQYEKNEMYFDYHLQEGKAKTTNAKYLMEQIGIL